MVEHAPSPSPHLHTPGSFPDPQAPDPFPDLAEKLSRLTAVAAARELHTLVIRAPANLTWLLGARVHVPQTLDTACLDVIVDCPSGELTIVANAIEAPRLRDTELAGLTAAWRVVPWWEDRKTTLPSGPGVGTDADLGSVRRVLTLHQRTLLAEVCADAAKAATTAVLSISPATSEYGAAAELARQLMERGLDPVVMFAAGDERIGPHRHPLPTDRPLGRRAMLVCVARRHGLMASVTRLVGFGTAADDGYRRLLAVEASFLDATRPGVPIGKAFTAGVAAYAANGFAPQEWHRHHQGGFTGFAPREYLAHFTSTEPISEGSVVAWNPSGAGWKVEDTCLVGAAGPVPLVHDEAWPTVTVEGRRRPDVYVR